MAEYSASQMILAVLQGDDSDNTIRALNEAGFFVTLLSSTGGFLKKRSTTVMIGVEEEKLPRVLEILKHYAGKRTETVYQSVALPHAGEVAPIPPIPMTRQTGGVTVFVMDLRQMEKF
jgi:uncharacterized protein YaaQ